MTDVDALSRVSDLAYAEQLRLLDEYIEQLRLLKKEIEETPGSIGTALQQLPEGALILHRRLSGIYVLAQALAWSANNQTALDGVFLKTLLLGSTVFTFWEFVEIFSKMAERRFARVIRMVHRLDPFFYDDVAAATQNPGAKEAEKFLIIKSRSNDERLDKLTKLTQAIYRLVVIRTFESNLKEINERVSEDVGRGIIVEKSTCFPSDSLESVAVTLTVKMPGNEDREERKKRLKSLRSNRGPFTIHELQCQDDDVLLMEYVRTIPLEELPTDKTASLEAAQHLAAAAYESFELEILSALN